MMRKVKGYLKKGFLMLLVSAMVCSNSGISALATTIVVADDTVQPAAVSGNSATEPQVEEPQVEESQEEMVAEEVETTAEVELPTWEETDLDREAEASDSTEVEYIYPEGSTSPSAINLNGNSVIIQASENDDTSSSPRKINLILDTDKDGVIDDGEEMVEIDGSTDLMGGPAIYGYYSETDVTEPISITVISGFAPVIFGAYQSSLKTTNETAITMRLLGGEVLGNFYAANASQVISTGAPAVEMYIDTEATTSTSQIMGAMSSEVKVSGTDKPGVYVEMNKGNVGSVYGFQGCSYTYTESTAAAVQMDVNGAGFSSVYGIQGGQVISDGKETTLFDMNIKAPVNAFYGAQSATLNAGANTAMAMDIDVTGVGTVTGTGYGVYGSNSSSSSYLVTGNVDINYAPDASETNNINWFYGVSQYLRVDGNVTMKLENTRGYGAYLANYQCDITGDVTYDVPKGNELTSSVYGLYSSRCGGDLTVRVHGCTENTSAYNNIYGFSGRYGNEQTTTVGGDFTFEYLGGRGYYVYGGYGNSNSNNVYDKIGGNAEITIREGDFYSLYLLEYADVTGDITGMVGDFTTDTTVSGTELESCKVSNSFYPIYYCNAKNITYKVRITNGNDDNKPYHYGVYYCNVSGDVDIEIDGGCYNYLYGTYNTAVGGNVDVQIKNVNKENEKLNNGGTSYGVYGANIAGNVKVNVEDCKFYSFYATYYHGCGGTITSSIKDVEVYNYLYGSSPNNCGGDIVSTIENATASYVYGVYQSGKIDGNVTSVLKNLTQNKAYSSYGYMYGFYGNSGYTVEKDVTVTMEECSFTNSYGASSGAIMGNLNVDIKGGTYGSSTESTYNYFASPTHVKGTSTINVSDVTYYGNVYPYYCSSGGCGDATITVENTQFNTGYYPNSEQISMSPGEGQKVTVTIDDDCSVADTLKIYAGSGNGEGKITYGDEIYVGGAIRVEEDTTYDAIHFSGGNLHVVKDATLKVDEFYWDSGTILLDGTLDVAVMNEVNDDGVYPNTTVYMAGGTMNIDLAKVQTVYWPYTETYKAKGGTVAYYNKYSYKPVTHSMGGNRLFAKVGQEIKYNISAAEGYTLASVTYTADEVTNNVANSGTTYTFTMPDAAVDFVVDFQGNQIVVGKTVTDPVLKLNVATTQEAPAYDFSTLSISNDGLVGEVSYKVDSTYTLPEGLSLEGDKIIGTPTVAYESGKKTIIHVTGKNDTAVELSINFVVTAGNSTQTSQEGRITVDDENLMIYLNGNSVIIETEDNQTSIYLDDNRDGKADYETPAVVGDYTNHTLYGLRNTDTKTPIRITMNGGTIGTIYGAQNGDITADGVGLGIYISGGSVGSLVMLDGGANVSDLLEVVITPEATVTGRTEPGAAQYSGYYYDYQGTVYVRGIYDITKDLTANILWLYGTHTIPKGVTVSVTSTLYCYSGSVIKLKGTLTANTRYTNSSYYNGKLLMMGGSIPDGEDNTWGYVYYPTETTTNIKNTSVTYKSTTDYYLLTENDVQTRYVRAGSVQLSVTQPTGYDYYYSLNGGDPIVISSPTSLYVNTVHKANTIEILYVPKQIELVKLFAEPIGVVGTEYTADAPLYDLRGLTILNDTTANYGGDVKYTLKSTSKLPAGLTFENGRIIGTPTTVNMSGTTASFVVTGRNGTTESIDVVLKIANEGYETKDINDLVKVSGSSIDLNGTSVVILEDPLNSNNSQIFMDENQDGTADNNNPLKIGTATSYNLTGYTISGYTNVKEAYEGDITITVKGGKLTTLYGVRGTGASDSNMAKVNGTVTLNLGDVYMSGTATKVYGAYYGQAENVKLSVYDGTYYYTDFYGAYGGKITGNLDYEIKDDAYFYGSSGSSYYIYFYPAYDTKIGGNANVLLGVNADGNLTENKGYRYSEFNGFRACDIEGNVNYKIDGYWYTGEVIFVYGGSVGGNLDVDVASGSSLYSYDSYPYMTFGNAVIEGDLLFDIEESASFALEQIYFLYNSTAKNLRINVPESCTSSPSSLTQTYGSGAVEEGVYINNKGSISIGGTYTISEDIEARGVTILANANVTIPQNVTVETTYYQVLVNAGATLTNKGTLNSYNVSNNSYGVQGTLINEGVLNISAYSNSYSYYFTIYSTGSVINKEGGKWNLECRLINSGKIVNYGDFVQTYSAKYYYNMGTFFTTMPLTLSWDPTTNTYYRPTYTAPYSTFYYPVTIEYPSHCTDSVTLSGDAVASSGVEGDTNQYVKALGNSYTSPTFTVTVGETKLDTVKLTNVTYGPKSAVAAENTDGTWTGHATGIFEPFTIMVNYDAADEEAVKITLDKTSDRIENTEESQPLLHNKYYSYNNPLYNLANIGVQNDMEGDGEVTYYLDTTSVLPKGLSFRDGRLYGTLQQASEEDQDIVFIVKGRNQTSAAFTLTLGPVAKSVPAWAVPSNLSALIGETLADVSFPYSSYGTYSWPDATVSVGNKVTTLEDQTLYFTPNDTTNFDWAAVAEKVGGTFDGVKIICKANVKVSAAVPTYTVPGTITATYGDTYGDVEIPSGDNDGKFVWDYVSTAKVGEVGSYIRWVNYIPNDSNYQTVYYIQVTLVVEKAIPTYKKISSVSQECGSTLADIILPDVEGGKYQWITTATTIPLDGKTYQVGFKPDDTINYDWTKIEGWNEAWKCVVFPITVNLNHTYSTELTYDETHHWYPCLDETCDSVEGKEEHLWDEGFVLEEATMEEEGLIEYSCECGASYEEVIPKLTHPKHIYTGAWKYDADGHWKQCTYTDCVETTEPEDHEFDEGVPVSAPTASAKGIVKYTCEICKYVENEYLDEEEWENSGWADDEEEEMEVGDEFEDPDTKAEYEIAEGEEVIFLAPDKNSYTKFTVPNTVEFDGVYYKVTEIAPNAFKGNKKLKSIKIGSNIKTIGTRAFYGCSSLTTVTMGANVTTIGNSAFQNCTSLKKFTIPKNVSKIGSKAFMGCKKLLNMTIKTTKLTEKNVGKKAFTKMGSSNYKKTKVKVPKKKLKVYKKMLVKRGLSKQAKVKK